MNGYTFAALFGVLALSGEASALQVLVPRDGQRVSGDAVWLVVEAEESPSVTVDGIGVEPGPAADGTHHFRLQNLQKEVSVVRIRAGDDQRQLTLHGAAGSSDPFHAVAVPQCWSCHEAGSSGCAECHLWEGRKHEPMLAEGCGRCHVPPEQSTSDIAAVCAGCHPDYVSGKHGGLRHALRSERDPLRPGRGMDCASCHDPHAPRCLSCLGRPRLREWCKRCHGRL